MALELLTVTERRQFRTREQLGRTPQFVENVRGEAVEVWRHPTRPVAP
jgi:hypothetical protein